MSVLAEKTQDFLEINDTDTFIAVASTLRVAPLNVKISTTRLFSVLVDALWHWALTLQAKCLDGWKLYVSERKRKKARYADAMDRRRYRMIKEGCIRMLRYHGDVVAMRTKAAAYQKAKVSDSKLRNCLLFDAIIDIVLHLGWKFFENITSKYVICSIRRHSDWVAECQPCGMATTAWRLEHRW